MPMPTFATEAEIPDAFRPEYTQAADGQWRSKAEIELELEKGKKQTLLDEKKDEERKRKVAEDAATEAKRLLDAQKAGVPEAELQRLRDEDAAKRAAEITPLSTENEKLKAENRRLKLTDRVRALAVKSGVMADRIDDAMLLLDARVDLGDADGLVFKDAKGAVTTQDTDQFFAALKTEKPWLFAFTGGSGSGAPGSDSKGGSSTTTPPSDTTHNRKRAQIAGAF